MRILLAIILNACSLGVAAALIPGISVTQNGDSTLSAILAYLLIGTIFGIVNVVIKPIISILSLPLTCLTLGLFAVVINAAMLSLTAWLTSWMTITLVIDSFFWSAILGAIVVSIVSAILNRFLVSASGPAVRR